MREYDEVQVVWGSRLGKAAIAWLNARPRIGRKAYREESMTERELRAAIKELQQQAEREAGDTEAGRAALGEEDGDN